MSATQTYQYASALLDVCVAALDSLPGQDPPDEGLDGAPTRAFVSPGPPPIDCCPQLTVHIGTSGEEGTLPSAPVMAPLQRHTTGRVNSIPLVINIIRCSPVGKLSAGKYTPPPAAELDAVARQTDADEWVIWNRVYRLAKADELFVPKCQGVSLETAVPVDQQGGCTGWAITVRVPVQGYEPEVGT